MPLNLEADIHSWLKKSLSSNQVAELVCQAMLKDLKSKKRQTLSIGYTYLVRSGQTQYLLNFIFEHLWLTPEAWPWAHLLEALSSIWSHENPTVLKWLLDGATEHKKNLEYTKNAEHTKALPDFLSWQKERKKTRSHELKEQRQQFIDQLVTFRSQQLFEAEKKLLRKLEVMYPNDQEINQIHLEHKKRYAFEILNKRLNTKRPPLEANAISSDPIDLEWQQDMLREHLELGLKFPEFKKDLIISAMMLDLPEVAFEIVKQVPSFEDLTWLSLDVMLAARRYAELLNALAPIEIEKASDPETFFATAYLRAQAFWGLGQSQIAIEILESLISSRPQYRSAHTLINQWRNP